MGVCFSKKKDDPSSPSGKGKGEKPAAVSRDPPPTESPQEEKVKEVLSETPKTISRPNPNNKLTHQKKKEPDLGCDGSQVSEGFSTASTTLTETTTRAEEDEEERGIEMKKVRRPVTRSPSPAKLQKMNRSEIRDLHRQATAGKREIRGVDVGCRSARSSPSPARTRESAGNAVTRNPISSSSAYNSNYNKSSYNYKRDLGERSGRRSVSPAMKRSVAAAAMDQQQCRSGTNLWATTRVNGRSSPQRALHLVDVRRGQDGNNAPPVAGGEDGNLEGKESLENPLVSMECFIFL